MVRCAVCNIPVHGFIRLDDEELEFLPCSHRVLRYAAFIPAQRQATVYQQQEAP